MGKKEGKKRRRDHVGEVVEARRLTPGMVRIVLSGDGLSEFETDRYTDHYVKVHFPPADAPYSVPFDAKQIKAELPRELRPRTRSITVRRWQPRERLLTLDFVDHGPAGFAGPWAMSARPGDLLQMSGPGGGYAPDPEADWHLMVGDAAALPAIATALERVRPGVPTVVLAEVDGPEEELALTGEGDLDLRWIHTGDDEAKTGSAGTDSSTKPPLLTAVEAMTLPPGRGQAFVHGEAEMVRAVRRHLVVERGMPREALSASGYWKRDRSDEAWRAEKSEWKRLAEADLANA